MEVEMKIRGLMMDPMTNMPIVVLKDLAGDAVLPIWSVSTKQTPLRWRSKRSLRRGL